MTQIEQMNQCESCCPAVVETRRGDSETQLRTWQAEVTETRENSRGMAMYALVILMSGLLWVLASWIPGNVIPSSCVPLSGHLTLRRGSTIHNWSE